MKDKVMDGLLKEIIGIDLHLANLVKELVEEVNPLFNFTFSRAKEVFIVKFEFELDDIKGYRKRNGGVTITLHSGSNHGKVSITITEGEVGVASGNYLTDDIPSFVWAVSNLLWRNSL